MMLPEQDQVDRRHLWQSLYIMEHLLAASLGRPLAIVNERESANRLNTPIFVETDILDVKVLRGVGLEATTRSCCIIGSIFKDIYQQPQASVKAAQRLVEKCMQLSWSLPAPLRWKDGPLFDRGQCAAVLNVYLTYWHTIILLTRPFFAYLASAQIRKTFLGDSSSHPIRSHDDRLAKFSNACVIASDNTIALVYRAYCSDNLSHFNFFTISHMLAASLILITKMFSWPLKDEKTTQKIDTAILILTSFGTTNPGAKGAAKIISRYRDVLRREAERREEALRGQQYDLIAPRYAAKTINNEDDAMTSAIPTNSSNTADQPQDTLSNEFQSTQPAYGLMETLAPQLSNEEAFTYLMDLDGPTLPPTVDQDPIISTDQINFILPCSQSYNINGISQLPR